MGELTLTIIKSLTVKMTTNHHDVMILQNWFSPVFPIGAFSYSHGLEMAIQDGRIMDQDSLYGGFHHSYRMAQVAMMRL